MPTRNVSLTDHWDNFVEAGVQAGRFNNASEVVREGLRLLEEREREQQAKLEWLRATAKEAFDAFDRGEGIPITDVHEFVSQTIAEGRAARKHARELSHG